MSPFRNPQAEEKPKNIPLGEYKNEIKSRFDENK